MFLKPSTYIIRENVNSEFSTITILRVAIYSNLFYKKYFETGMQMDFYHQFQYAIRLTNLIPFIKIHARRYEMIIQNPCSEGFDEGFV